MESFHEYYKSYLIECKRNEITEIIFPCHPEFWNGWAAKWCKYCNNINEHEWHFMAPPCMSLDWEFSGKFTLNGKNYNITLPSCVCHYFGLEYKRHRVNKAIEILEKVSGVELIEWTEWERKNSHSRRFAEPIYSYQHWRGTDEYYKVSDLVAN